MAAACAIIDLTASPTLVDLTFPTQEEEEEDEEEETPSLLLGSFKCDIVGIRYYTGTAHSGEYVQLLREPNNPYDKNAIRVDNNRGIKVGHIKATAAVALAPIMDTLEKVKMDGTIPSAGNAWTLPLKIEMFEENADDQARIDAIFRRFHHPWTLNRNLNQPHLQAPVVEVVKKTMDWKRAQQSLDDMFEKISHEQLTNLPDLVFPASLTANLMDHQKEGIRWLYQRENDTKEAPFYKKVKEKGKTVWLSEITNSSQPEAPAPVKGSILADDMGLGKSLQAIALILAHPCKVNEPKTTLIVCPVSVMSNWQQQITQHLAPDTLKVGLFHGADRYDLLRAESDLDVLIVSFGTLSTDYGSHFPKKRREGEHGPSIFETTFHRVILDEAHTIRNSKSRTFTACTALKATYRLCLTGTPLQNKPEDIHSLFSFLGVEPLGDRDIFRRAISQPIQNGEDVGLARLRTMMAFLALRRNKSKLNLVEKTVELRSIAFPPDSPHKKIHDTIFESAQLAFTTLASGDDKALKNYMMILETLTRIRQACVSGALVPRERLQAAEQVLAVVQGRTDSLTAEEGVKLLQKLKGAFAGTEATECAICLEEMEETAAVILRSCSHVFCESCLSKVSEQCHGVCPLCRQKFEPHDMIKKSDATAAATEGEGKPKALSETMDGLCPSPKLEALGLAIDEMKEGEKGVVFSQFTKFLDLIEPFITSRGHTFTRIDGSKTVSQRIAAVKEFSDNGGPRFILCSLHAADTGITLTRAYHCFLMDTWWNRSVEEQAMDRTHRIGQTRPVRVIRFVMKDTIEERMLTLQEAKVSICKGSIEKLKPDEVRKARIGDLKSLFSIKEVPPSFSLE